MRKLLQQRGSDYAFYATLLDAFQNYLDTDELWEKYFGHSEDPKFSADEWEDKQFVELINKINRVPFTNEAVEKGTAFNNIVDMLVQGNTESDRFVLNTDEERKQITIAERSVVVDENGDRHEVLVNPRTFPLGVAMEFGNYYQGAMPQFFTKGMIETCYGNVDLYGYIDYLMPFSVHDLKTCKSYSAGSFKNHWQHIVYPYTLRQGGIEVSTFEYNVTNFRETFTELYVFKEERDVPKLREMCESFIRFINTNRSLITDKKIFNNKG